MSFKISHPLISKYCVERGKSVFRDRALCPHLNKAKLTVYSQAFLFILIQGWNFIFHKMVSLLEQCVARWVIILTLVLKTDVGVWFDDGTVDSSKPASHIGNFKNDFWAGSEPRIKRAEAAFLGRPNFYSGKIIWVCDKILWGGNKPLG